MSGHPSILVQFSDALAALAGQAVAFTAAVRGGDGALSSGVLWTPNAVVVSEQALSDGPAFGVKVGAETASATIAGRDEGTNVAVLKLDRELPGGRPAFAAAKTGALAIVAGASGEGVSVRLATVHSVGGAWESLAGGTIDQRIMLDASVRRTEEGGPVLAANGGLLGISTRGVRRQTLVIPASTVDKAVTALLDKGSIARGWLGVALRPVALPEALRPEAAQRVGLMVMEVSADGPAAKGGILAGDILLSVAGTPATRLGAISRRLGPDSIGNTIEVTIARTGAATTCRLTVEARRAA